MIRFFYRKSGADTKCRVNPFCFRSCFVGIIATFIAAVLVAVWAFSWIRSETLSVLTVENQTEKEITTLTAVWTDGGATPIRKTLPPGEKVTMKYSNSTEGGGVELLLKFRGSSQWCHARALGYLDYSTGGELAVILDEDNIHPLCCAGAGLTQSGSLILITIFC